MDKTQSRHALRIQLAADAAAGLIHGIRCTAVPSDAPIDSPIANQVTLELELRVEWEGSLALWLQAGYRRGERFQHLTAQADFWRLALHLATATEDFAPRHVEFVEDDYLDAEIVRRVPVKSAVELAAVLLHLEQIGAQQVKVETVAEHLTPAHDPRDGIDRIEGERVAVRVDQDVAAGLEWRVVLYEGEHVEIRPVGHSTDPEALSKADDEFLSGGLDTSHGCWHGAYSAFGRWRKQLASQIGISLDEMQGFGGSRSWPSPDTEPLVHLLNHSDCDGQIESQHCAAIADRLAALIPGLPEGDGGGHIGDWREKTQTFIDGLRLAAELGENVDFH